MKFLTLLLLLPFALISKGLHSDMGKIEYELHPTTPGAHIVADYDSLESNLTLNVKTIMYDSNTVEFMLEFNTNDNQMPLHDKRTLKRKGIDDVNYTAGNIELILSNNTTIQIDKSIIDKDSQVFKTKIKHNIRTNPNILDLCEFPISTIKATYYYYKPDGVVVDTRNINANVITNTYYNQFQQTKYFTRLFSNYGHKYTKDEESNVLDFITTDFKGIEYSYMMDKSIEITGVIDPKSYEQTLSLSINIDKDLKTFFFELSLYHTYNPCGNIKLILSDGTSISIPQFKGVDVKRSHRDLFKFTSYPVDAIPEFMKLTRCKIVGVEFDEFEVVKLDRSGYILKHVARRDVFFENSPEMFKSIYDFKYNVAQIFKIIEDNSK